MLATMSLWRFYTETSRGQLGQRRSHTVGRTGPTTRIRPDGLLLPDLTLRSAQGEASQADADLASDLIAPGVTTQSVDTVVAVLSAYRGGASINAAAKASGINYRTAQRIMQGAERRHHGLVAVG
jgi:hypothetical protein